MCLCVRVCVCTCARALHSILKREKERRRDREKERGNQTLDRAAASLLIRTANVRFSPPPSCTLITRVEIDGFATDTVKRF